VSEPPAAVQDRGDGDDVIGIGRVPHAEQEAEAGKGEQLTHRSLRGRCGPIVRRYCKALQ
jgi:hypothetical protein